MTGDAPFCFWCGYNLTGLELPRLCPECGHLADPEKQAVEARQWFASRRTWLRWLNPRSPSPAGLGYVLDDVGTIRLSRRRAIWFAWLPAAVTLLIVLLGASFEVRKQYRCYYYSVLDPQRTPLRTRTEVDLDRPYNFNLDLHFDLFFTPPPTWRQDEELKSSHAIFNPPPGIDWLATIWAVVPLLVLLCTRALPSWVLFLLAWIIPSWALTPAYRRCIRTLLNMQAAIMGIGAWCWLLAVVIRGVDDLMSLSERGVDLGMLVMLGAAGACLYWLLAAVFGWVRMVRADRARKLFPWLMMCWLGGVMMSVGGPILGCWLLIRIVMLLGS